MSGNIFDESIKVAETRLTDGEQAAKELESRREEEFENSLGFILMGIPYIVWKRKNLVKYYDGAPRTPEECPFGFIPKKEIALSTI
jgi:hypothetical protein